MPQEAWSNKDERQYEKIKKSAKSRGKSESRAKEIAAATVNKQRRKEDRTKSGKKSTSGSGNPTAKLEDRSKQELYNRAKELGIEGRSKMDKQELVRAIRKAS
ncbi:MAG TPA: Rho termination factor N-terminal domain-containing protein [Thermoanaerobaculia bacterium]